MNLSVRLLRVFVLLMVVDLAVVPAVAHADDTIVRQCPEQVGEGVICTGPVVPQVWLPQIQTDERPCPLSIGEGVICRGPDIPEGMQATDNAVDGRTVITRLSSYHQSIGRHISIQWLELNRPC